MHLFSFSSLYFIVFAPDCALFDSTASTVQLDFFLSFYLRISSLLLSGFAIFWCFVLFSVTFSFLLLHFRAFNAIS